MRSMQLTHTRDRLVSGALGGDRKMMTSPKAPRQYRQVDDRTLEREEMTVDDFPTTPEQLSAVPLIQWFVRRADRFPVAVAFRYKDLGIWHEVSWRKFRDEVETTALGLEKLGVQPGSRVVMMGESTPEWLYFDFAAQSLGAIFYGIYVTTKPEDVRYVVEDGQPVVFLAEDQEYVDKLLSAEKIGGSLVDHIVVADTRGMFQYQDSRLLSFADLRELGSRALETAPQGYWLSRVDQRSADEISRISYTSGTTGRPKGAMLSSRNLVWASSALYFSMGNDPGPSDRTVSYMPPASPAEVAFSLVIPVLYGTVPHIPEDASARNSAFVEVSPTLLLGFPRMWETHAARALVDIETGKLMKRRAYKAAMRLSGPYYRTLWSGEAPGRWDRFRRWLAYIAVFKHLLDKFGLGRTRFVITGGAPVSPDIIRLWNTWGVAVQEIYGMTEVGGLATVQMDGRPMPGVAGRALYGMEVRLADDGEILLRSPGVFHGYWGKPEATHDVLDADGWMHTGDIGRLLPDGNLKVVDRRGDLLETLDGRLIAASEIEHMVKRSPYVREAMLAGSQRPFLTVLIEIDSDAVSEWARANRILYTSFSSLIQSESVHRLLADVIAGVNIELEQLGRPRIMDFRILPKELDPEEGDEVTSTNKVRRRQLGQKFDYLLNEMYGPTQTPTGGSQ